MAIARDQTATGQAVSASTVTLTWPTSPAAGAKALVLIQTPGSGVVTTVKDNGAVQSTYTKDFLFNGGGGDLLVYRADGIHLPSSGSYTVTITLSGTNDVVAGGRTYTGVATGAPASSTDNTGTSGTCTTGNVTPAVGSLLAGGFANDSGANPETITLTTSGASAIYTHNNGSSVIIGGSADNIATTTSAQGLTWTFGDAPDWGAYVAVYNAAASTVTSTGSASLASMAASGTGAETITSTGSASLASMAAAGSGSTSGFVTSAGSASLASMAATGTGSAPVIASGSASMASMRATGSGSENIAASGSASLASVTAGGAGTETIGSSGSASLASMAASGTGTETIGSTGSASLASMSAGGTGAAPVIASGSASLASMSARGTSGSGTVTVAGEWTASFAVAAGFQRPYPAATQVQVPVENAPGDWLFALVAWRPSATGSGVSIVVADDAHNWWEPVGAPSADSGAAGAVRTAVWAAPAARVANSVTGVTVVQVAATGPVLSYSAAIMDMAGLLPWYQVAAIGTALANAATSLSVSSAAPPARALLFAAFASDDNTKTVTGPSGWTALTGTSAGNGVDTTVDIRLTPAWQVTTGAASASVTASGPLDLSGVIAGVIISAPQPAQPNPDWPVMITEAAIGSGVQTPPSEMTWTQLGGRSLALSVTQGRQYSLGQLQAGQGTIRLDDPDGALIPPGTGAYAGIDSGTPLRRRVIWPGLPGSPNLSPNYVAFSGYFRRWPWNVDAALLRGQVQAEISDVWAYGNGTLNSMAIEEALLDSPHSLWPLTDPPGSTGAGNLVPNGAPLPLVASKYGAGGATVTWGYSSPPLTGMSSAQVTASGAPGGASGMFSQQLAGTSLYTAGQGYALAAPDPAFPPVSGGVTIECWAQVALGATQRGGASTTSPMYGGTASLPAGQAVILSAVPGFTFPTGPTAGVIYFVLAAGTQYDLSATPGGPPVTVTAVGSFFITPTTPWNPVILAARGISGTVAQLEVAKLTGALTLRYRPAAVTSDTLVTVDASRDYRDGAGALIHLSLAFNQAAWRVMINGGATPTASGSFSSALPATFGVACFGGVMDRVSQGLAFTGALAMCGVYPGISQPSRVLCREYTATAGMVGENACDRIERLLEYGGLTGRRWIGQENAQDTPEDVVVSGRDAGGQAAVSCISNVVQSTLPAYACVAPTGDLTYRSKVFTWNEPARWALGDNTAAGEVPFAPGSVATDYDPSRVTARVQLTQLDTQAVTTPSGVMSATTMADVAVTAAGQYGGQPYQQTGYLALDWSSGYTAGPSLTDLANWVQAVYARPANRVQSVTVDAARHPAAWPFWAGAAVGDIVTVNVRLPTAAVSPLISLTARVTQTARSSQFSQEGTEATITATLDFAPECSALTCDDPVRGLLNGQNVLPW